MNTQKKTQFMTLTDIANCYRYFDSLAMPFKIVIPPASYTLGSHVAIFIAMFLSPWMAIFVIIASSLGFLMAWLSNCHCTSSFLPYLFRYFGSLLFAKTSSNLR